jgi:hypothetical protein
MLRFRVKKTPRPRGILFDGRILARLRAQGFGWKRIATDVAGQLKSFQRQPPRETATEYIRSLLLFLPITSPTALE